MKLLKIISATFATVLVFGAQSSLANTKIYKCDNGFQLTIGYRKMDPTTNIAVALKVTNDSQYNGNYTAMGDGGGFATQDQSRAIFLDSNLYTMQVSGEIQLDNTLNGQRASCSR